MKVHYFYLSQGVTRGPLSKEEVIQLIQNRQLYGLDLVLKETSSGVEDWKPLNEMNEFQNSFKEMAHQEEPLDWVVLVQRGKGQFLQNGPFSLKDVRNHLRDGRLRYTDYAWKKGMSEWVRLADLEEFRSKKKIPKIDKIDPLDVNHKDTLPAIPKISYAKKSILSFDLNPYLADRGEEIEIELEQDNEVEVEQINEDTVEYKPETKPTSYLKPFVFETPQKNQWMVLASAALLILLFILLYQLNKKQNPSAITLENKPIIKEVVENPPTLNAAVSVPITENKKELEEKIAPTQIGFTAEKNTLLIQSNGSRHYPIRLLVVGLPGQLQEGRVWFKSLVARPEKGIVTIRLSDFNLTPGNYRIRISTETGLKIEKDLAFDVENKQFLKLRNKNRKEQSYWYLMDRLRLIQRIGKMKEALYRYSRQQETSFAFLKEKDLATEKIYYFEWEKYTELKHKVLRMLQKNRAMVQKDLEGTRVEVENLSQRLGLLSIWR